MIALCQQLEGYATCRLRSDRNENLVGFVEFSSKEFAERALDRLQGYKFDPMHSRGIAAEFARNLEPKKRPRDSDTWKSSSNDRDRPSSESRDRRRSEVDHPARDSGHRSDTRAPNPPPAPYLPPPTMAAADAMANPIFANPFIQANLALALMGHRGVDPMAQGMAERGFDPMMMQGMPEHALPPDASSTLYVEGLPEDAAEREVAHIFRPFPGFNSLRILPKKLPEGSATRAHHLCFVEFDDRQQANYAMQSLQGYRMDKADTRGLTLSFARTDPKRKIVISDRERLKDRAPSASRRS